MVTIEGTETREELAESIANLNAKAKRCVYELDDAEWGKLHRGMDRLLDKLTEHG